MRYGVLLLAVVLFGCLILQGCPALSGGNTFRLHNKLDQERVIGGLALTRPGGNTDGVNILAEPLMPGETFTVRNLPDGEYRISVWFQIYPGDRLDRYSTVRLQYMEAGRTYDWYFNEHNQSKADNDIVITEPVRGLWPLLGKYLDLGCLTGAD